MTITTLTEDSVAKQREILTGWLNTLREVEQTRALDDIEQREYDHLENRLFELDSQVCDFDVKTHDKPGFILARIFRKK